MHRNHGYVGDETQGFLLATVVQGSDNIIQWIGHHSEYREDICLQTSFLLFKFANHRNKRLFVLTANKVLVGTLMTIGDVNNIFAINIPHVKLWPSVHVLPCIKVCILTVSRTNTEIFTQVELSYSDSSNGKVTRPSEDLHIQFRNVTNCH